MGVILTKHTYKLNFFGIDSELFHKPSDQFQREFQITLEK